MEMKKVEFKKVVIATLVIALCAPFVACSNQHDDRTDFTTRATESAYDPSIKEPDQTINTMSPDQTTETPADTTETSVAPNQTGKYTYTVYAGTEYETTLSMDVNIDDYLISVNWTDKPFFSQGMLAENLGWYDNGDPNNDWGSIPMVYCTYLYEDNTMMVFSCGDNYSDSSNAVGYPQMGSFTYHLAPMSDYDADARSKEEIQSSEKNYGIYVTFGQHSSDLCYTTINNGNKVSISRDDAIVLAYIFSSAISKPGENPFYGTNLEKAKTSVADRYIMYTLP
jgi:hypothetical protein